MNARRLILAAVDLLCSFALGVLFAAPVALAEEPCPNAASRQGPSVNLPDCRAYEQVTPVNKGDAVDLFATNGEFGHNLVSAPETGYPAEMTGNRFLLISKSSSFANGVSGRNTYVFTRTRGGWTTSAIAPTEEETRNLGAPQSVPAQGGGNLVFDWSSLAELAFNVEAGSSIYRISGDPSALKIANMIGPPGGPYTTISSESGETAFSNQTNVVGASSDLGHVVVESKNHALILGGVAEVQDPGSEALYEAVGGPLRPVNVTTNGSLVSQCGAILGQGDSLNEDGEPGGTYDAVSSDGSRIIFTAPDPRPEGPGCWNPTTSPQENPPQLYMRVNGTKTVEISIPNIHVNDPGGPRAAVYVGASGDDSKVFFMTRAELTADAVVADGADHAPELYEYDVNAPEGERLVRVSGGEAGASEGNVDFVPAISRAEGAEGTQVYFAAFGRLKTGLPALEPERVYLYRYATGTGKTTYIATIGSPDYPAHPAEQANLWYSGRGVFLGAHRSKEVGPDATANWYTTTNGRYLVFVTKVAITGYNSKVASGFTCDPLDDAVSREDCYEIYRYDAANNGIVCVSCGSPGVTQVDDALFARAAGESPDATSPRPISEDGNYVFFDTANALVPGTTSTKVHVYEWHNGSISLISSVGDPGDAFFLGSSEKGDDVFFGTHAQLSPQDTDVSGDLYDARVGGGFVGLAAAQCTGTGCQGVPSAQPIFATPSSVTFAGVGNFPPSAGSSLKAKVKRSSSAQKLARALKACRRDADRHRRARCQTHARKQYGGAKRANKSSRRGY
jgi:hypothetical protein